MEKYKPRSIFAPLPVTKRGANFHLTCDPKFEKFVYCSGTAVVVRDLKDPLICYTYNEHPVAPTAACFAPSGFYICSGDSRGNVRVWDTTQETHLLKYEGHALGGPIKDITWSPDSKRILVCGEGGQTRSHCFLWDSGSSCGTLGGHSKAVNAIAHSPARPFRAATVGDDYHVFFFHGVPYKYAKTISEHKAFVNSVRFSPTGTTFCTVSSDKRALLFDGKDGEKCGEFKDGEEAHSGGIMAVSYKADGAQLMTASADKTVKLWDAETQQLVSTFAMGSSIDDQQLGCLWAGDYLLSLSFTGNINYLDPNSNEVVRVIKGHQRSIEALAVYKNKIVTASFDGRMVHWDSETGDGEYFTGALHKNKVLDMRINNDVIVSADIQNKILRTSLSCCEMGEDTSQLPSKPNCMDTHDIGLEVYACENELIFFKDGNEISKLQTSYQPFGVAFAPSGRVLAVSDQANPKIYLYDIEGDSLVQRQVVDVGGAATELAYSPDGALLGGGSSSRNPLLLDVNNGYKAIITAWSGQSKLTSCQFSPNSRYLAVAGIDTNILICDTTKPMDLPIKILRAHPKAPITRVRWLNDVTIVTTASDSQVRQWTLNL